MAEDADFSPGAWKGHDFASAREFYADHAGRSYAEANAKGVEATSLVPSSLTTQSTSPLVVMVDVTGSMTTWPAVIFSKLPYLDIEGKEYLGPDMEISFAANTDLDDGYPLQIRKFGTGPSLKTELSNFIIGGGAGPVGGQEAYEMGALYYAFNVDMPNAVRPIFIFVSDEQPHAAVTSAAAQKYAKVDLGKKNRMTVDEVFDALKTKYSVYLVHKRYEDGGRSRQEWVRLIGADRVVDLDDPERIVDVIFGILAQETGRVDYFKKEIEGRQNPRQVATVYKALGTVHAKPATPPPSAHVPSVDMGRFEGLQVPEPPPEPAPVGKGKSTLHRPTGGKPAKGLLGG